MNSIAIFKLYFILQSFKEIYKYFKTKHSYFAIWELEVTKCPTEKTDSFWISANLKASGFTAGPVEQWYPD